MMANESIMSDSAQLLGRIAVPGVTGLDGILKEFKRRIEGATDVRKTDG